MKKRIIIAIAITSLATSCATTQYRTGSYTTTYKSSYKKGGVEYRLTRTYTSSTIIDTIKIR